MWLSATFHVGVIVFDRCAAVLVLVLNFGSGPEPSRTGAGFRSGFGFGAEPDRTWQNRSEPGPNHPELEGQHAERAHHVSAGCVVDHPSVK